MRTVVLVLALMGACKPIDDKSDDDTAAADDSDPPPDTDESDPPPDTDETDPPPDTDETDPPPDTDETDPPPDTDETDETDDTDPPGETDETGAADTDPPDTVDDTVVVDTSLDDTVVDDTSPPDDTAVPPGETADDSADTSDSADTGDHDDTAPPRDTWDTDVSDSGGFSAGPWRASLVVDGDLSDCPLGARFQTSSGAGPWACITWTETDLYVGFHHPDVTSGGPTHYLWLYAGGKLTLGAPDGVLYNTQQPALSPIFQTHVRWQATHTFNSKLSYSGGAWGGEVIDYLWTSGDIAENPLREEVELRIPLADLTDTTVLPLALGWLFSGTGAERTYAGVPAAAFADGYDPDVRAWYSFNLTASTAPNAYLPLTSP